MLRRLERGPGASPPPRPDDLIARLEDGSGNPPDARDRALARELVFGVLRWRRLLDHTLASYCRRPLAGLDPGVRTALRLGLYQLRFLDRVPHRAAVSEAVSLAAAASSPAAGLANAVLRAYLRADHPWPHAGGDPELYLRTGLSHPDWLVDRYVASLGRERAIRRMEANNRRPTTFLRVSARRDLDAVRRDLEASGVSTERFPLAPRCLRVVHGNPRDSPLHAEGAVHLQDAGSQLIGWLLPVAGARRCLDACAAPGGKATLLAERIEPGWVLAGDRRPRRIRLLREAAKRLGTPTVLPFVADAALPPIAEESLDRVLADVPCSGLGTLARNPDIKWTSSASRVASLGAAAQAIAVAGARLLAPGGFLLYAVCSLEPEETTQVVEALLEARPELRRAPLDDQLPPTFHDLLDADGALRLTPESHGADGYFAALLQRTTRATSGR